MEKVWLTKELDNTPYFYDKEKLDAYLAEKQIDEKREKINEYFETHPDVANEILSQENRQARFNADALSFLNLEDHENFDFTNISEEQTRKLVAYREACEMAHEICNRPDFFIDQNLLVRIHRQLCSGSLDKNLYQRFEYRNVNDPTIVIGHGYFEPVPGEQVSTRMSMLLHKFYNNKQDEKNVGVDWANDNIFARGAKFVTEYTRIQPHMDGNKRMALIMLNCILETNGYADIYFNKDQIDRLHDRIKESMLTRDVTEFAMLIANKVNIHYNHLQDKIANYEIQKSISSYKEKTDNTRELR